jgi:hypothetical protein
MRCLSRIHKFFLLSPKQMLLLMEAYLYLGWARLLKQLPFSSVAPSLGTHMSETNYEKMESDRPLIEKISKVIHTMSRFTFWESQCLVKAVAAMKMLERRGLESTLYLGTAKEEDGKMVAHAWLRSGAYYVTGAEEMGKFTVVSTFGNGIGDSRLKGDRYGKRHVSKSN